MLRRLAIASVMITAACAGQQKAAGPAATASVQERMRITNQPVYDVALCHPRQLTLPQPPNQATLVGALISTRPQVMECLVDPKNRGQGATTKATVKTHITETEATHAVTGENLTPEGQKCIQDAVNKAVAIQPLTTKGAQPVDAQAEFIHELNNSPAITFGINEGSDFSGQIRLAQEQWCDCYAAYATQAPPVLTAKITLKKASATPADITFEPSGSTEGDQLAACLKAKIAALPAKLTSDELSFPHRFVHFHSLATEAATSLPPELRFYQLELVRGQRAASTAIALGVRANAAEAYDAIVTEYKKDPKKNWNMVSQLKDKCAALVKAADEWIAAIEAQQSAEQQTVTIVQELKAKDEGWANVETASQAALANTQKDLEAARQRRTEDQAACPKERGK
ncbi:hypothetical protein [Hyalangium gracile]|uniref:hypothetical protein n=1 Tax=Hyalangium gracile TaxID=394092 RepID=UPI001CCBD43B|nr:hypothetical protein [Hyalangium gracile]